MLRTISDTPWQKSRVTCFSLLLIVLAVAPSFATSEGTYYVQTVLYQGTAYGVSANAGNTVVIGPTGEATLQQPCGTDIDNETVTGTSAGVNHAPLVTGGVSNTSVTASPNQTSQAIADVTGINLLAGLITAQELKSVSTTSLTASGFQSSSAGSAVTNLLVAGIPYNAVPAPNTQVGLPGIGYVVLNEQTTFVNSTEGQLTVNMVHVYVTMTNILGIPVGTQIVVSSANSGMVRALAPGVLTGTSFGTQVSVAGVLDSSPTAQVSLPCYGTSGQVITSSVASLNLAGVLTSGTVVDTGESKLLPPYSEGEMTTQVENLNLLSGLVTANVIYGRTDARIAGTQGVFITALGTFTGIVVAGHPEINDNVPYNTSVDIAGLGTLYLKHIIRNYPNPDSIEIRMVELVVSESNTYGLPIGADILIGDAQMTIIPAAEP